MLTKTENNIKIKKFNSLKTSLEIRLLARLPPNLAQLCLAVSEKTSLTDNGRPRHCIDSTDTVSEWYQILTAHQHQKGQTVPKQV